MSITRAMHPDSDIAALAEQYDRFPFPPVAILEQEDANRDLRESFNVDFNLSGNRRLRSGGKMWVPGCGTRWAAMLSLQFGDMEIIGSDLSESSLAVQERLLDSLGIKNVELRHEDMLRAGYVEEFDFISCVGVLHHLPDPALGFAAIAAALKPTGLVEVMVYDLWNRHLSKRMQEILTVFDPRRTLHAESRYDLALALLRSVNERANTPRELKRVLRLLDTESGFARELADFVSHPREYYFDVPSLVSALQRAKLTPRFWKQPHLFDPRSMLDDTELGARIAALEPVQRAHLGHLLSTGLLEVFAEPSGSAQTNGAPVHRRRTVRAMNISLRHYANPEGTVTHRRSFSKLTAKGSRMLFDGGERRPAVLSYGVARDCVLPGRRRLLALTDLGFQTVVDRSLIERILSLAQTPTTIGEIAQTIAQSPHAGALSEDDIVTVCDALCRTPFRVLATVDHE